MKIYELMTSQPHTIDENATVLDVARKMQLLGCGILPVENNHLITGVITDRDIINRVISQKLSPESTHVRDVMTKSIIFCYEDDTIPRAVNLMNKNKIRRILVKNEANKLVGILSIIDIFRRLKDKSMLSSLFCETVGSV